MTSDAEKKRIVLVEDNPSEIYLFRETLSPEVLDADLRAFGDGDAMLDYMEEVARSPAEPHLVLLDYNLPRMSGIELFRRVRAVANGQAIAFLSGTESPEHHSAMAALQPAAILSKPRTLQEFHELWERIRMILARA